MDFGRKLVSKYSSSLVEAESLIDRLELREGLQGKRACRRGCCSCCSHLVELYEYEWLCIVSYLNESQRTDMLDSMGEWVLKIGTSIPELLDSYDCDPMMDKPQLDRLKLKYQKLSIPCIFLHDGECMIYPVRPTACMNYFSYGESCRYGDLDSISNSSKSFGEVEDWISEEMASFFIVINKNSPIYFNPFSLRFLPSYIINYLSQNN